jgi:hypothetical protein
MDFNLKSLWESQEIPKQMEFSTLAHEFIFSSSNCSNSESFDQIHQISFKFKRLKPFLIFNSDSRPNFEKFQ